MFNLGPGELVMLGLLGLMFLGPNKLPDAIEDLREAIEKWRGRLILSPRWSWSWPQWVLVSAALLSAAVALALLVGPSR